MRIVSRLALQLLVSAVFLGVVLWRADVHRLGQELARADWRSAFLAVPFFGASAVLHGVRWWLLVRRAGSIPLRAGVLALLATAGVDLLLPLHAGMVALFQVLHRRYGVERAAVLGSLGAEGLVDALALLLLGLLVLPVLHLGGALTPRSLAPVAALVALGALGLLLGSRPTTQRLLLAVLPARLRAPVGRSAGHLARSFAAFGSAPSVLLLVVVTVGDWSAAALGHAVVGHGFRLGVPLPTYLLVEVAGNLSTIVPLTQGNVGPYELVLRETLAAAGADGARAAAFAVGTHALGLLTTMFIAVAAALALRLRTEDLFYLRRPGTIAPEAE